MSSDRSVRLLVVHETQNAAEELANLLRNSGMATQMTFIASANEFEQKLVQSQWDLIVIREGIEVVPTLNALGITKRYASNSPVLVLVDTLDDDLASDWFDAGASDICIEDHESLLLNRMRNLIQAYHFQLDASALNQQLEESEQRCQSMLQSSKDAIAYVHGGMHIFANQSYIELFECEDEDEVFCTPIMDFIDSSIHSQLKESLKNKFSSEELVTTAITAKEERLAVTLDFAPATYEGESCTQVIVRLKQDDVVENTVLEARLKELSQIDSVTGLLNFQAFTEQLEQQMTDDASAEFSLFYVLFSNALEIKQQVGFKLNVRFDFGY